MQNSFSISLLIINIIKNIQIDGSPPVRGNLEWSVEFNYEGSPNKNDWIQEIGGHGWGNNELQYYTDSNSYVSNGKLTITSKREFKEQSQYTSSRLLSKRAFKYGVIEARAKIPKGRGTWPAFWLLAANRPLNWPLDGEIDVLEHVGYDPGTIHANIHCSKYNHVLGTNLGNTTFVNDIYNDFHTYTVDWNSKRLIFYVDDVEYFTYYKIDSSYERWPFDNPHNIILNTAVGGNWGGAQGVDDSIFPVEFIVDYVRQYEVNNQNDTGSLIRMKSVFTDLFVSADDRGYAPLIANREQPDYWETFKLIRNSDNSVSFLSIASNLFVSTEDPNWVQPKKRFIADSEKFQMSKNPDGSFSFKANSNGKFIRSKPLPSPHLIADGLSPSYASEFFNIIYL